MGCSNTRLALLAGGIVIACAASGPAIAAGNAVSVQSGLPSLKLPKLPRAAAPKASSAPRSTASADRKEMRRQADRVKALLAQIKAFRPDHRKFIADNDQAQQDAMQLLEEFRSKMAGTITPDLVEVANDPNNTYATREAKQADNFANMTARRISSVELDKFRNSSGRDDLAMVQYFQMVFREEQMQQLARLYPEREPIRSAQKVASGAMAELGSLASVKQGRAEAKAARIAATRLNPARRRDAGLERQFASAFKTSIWTQQEFAGSEILKVNLMSSGWTVRRNPITGIIISRDQQANLGVKRRDGKCFSYIVVFEQKHQGGGYGGSYMASGRDLEMLCENVSR